MIRAGVRRKTKRIRGRGFPYGDTELRKWRTDRGNGGERLCAVRDRSLLRQSAPNWCRPVIQSSVCQVQTIFPYLNSWMSMAWMASFRFFDGRPMKGAFCVPEISERTTTLFPS